MVCSLRLPGFLKDTQPVQAKYLAYILFSIAAFKQVLCDVHHIGHIHHALKAFSKISSARFKALISQAILPLAFLYKFGEVDNLAMFVCAYGRISIKAKADMIYAN